MQNKLLFLALYNIYLVVLVFGIQKGNWEVSTCRGVTWHLL